MGRVTQIPPRMSMPHPNTRSGALAPPMAVAAPALIAAIYAWAVFFTTFGHPGLIGLNYNAPGSDWMVLYEAARSAVSGDLPLIFDGDRFTAHLNATFAGWLSEPMPFRPWVYPPSFLLLLAPFAPLGFLASYAAFQLISGGLLGAALTYRAARPPVAGWLAAAVLISPAAAINVVDGQCGFLVTAILVAAFRLLGPRPLLAGAVLGLLTFKPQFWLLAPVALAAMGQWRALAAAIVVAAAMAVLSAAVFGVDAWILWVRQMIESYQSADPKWVQYGRIWGDSIYACALLLGLPPAQASHLQSLAILASAGAIAAIFRSGLSQNLKLAALLVATLLAAPHSASYDKVMLVVAAGLWLAEEARPPALWRWILALVFWLSAILSPPALSVPGRFIPLILAGFLALLLSQALHPRPSDPRPAGAA